MHPFNPISGSQFSSLPLLVCLQDGHFVDNLTIGAPVAASLRRHTDAFFDCHLMVAEPAKWVQVSAPGFINELKIGLQSLPASHGKLVSRYRRTALKDNRNREGWNMV